MVKLSLTQAKQFGAVLVEEPKRKKRRAAQFNTEWPPLSPEMLNLNSNNIAWAQIIYAHCQSKSNGRVFNYHVGSIKSPAAQLFVMHFFYQVLPPDEPIYDDVEASVRIFYPSRRNDVDAELIWDCLQHAGVIANDRQVRRKLIDGTLIDKYNPRVEIILRRL